MQIDGRKIAQDIYTELAARVKRLQRKHITPHLVVLLVGENPASVAYVKLKQKKADTIGAKVTILRFDESVTTEELIKKVALLNIDPFVHGILIQRPLPSHIDEKKLELVTAPQKDVDGFHPDSPFVLPLAPAVVHILKEVYILRHSERSDREVDSELLKWLKSQKIVVIGKGPTGGGAITAYLKKLGIIPHVIDSKTKDPDQITKHADIIISAVGKHNIVHAKNTKKGVILVGVGVAEDQAGNMLGDYNEEEIKDTASSYTPTPGGTGPVNVAMLMDNLITAAERQTTKYF